MTRILRSTPEALLIAKLRRDDLRARGLCINGAGHGPALIGVRCVRCAARHGGYATRVDRLSRELRRIAHA